jgi:hypothetical protein
MFGLRQLFYPWGFLVQIVALVHFVRRRPDNYWLYIILFGGFLGASAYIVVEVLPDAGLLRGVFQGFGRRSRIHNLEIQIIDNPSAWNRSNMRRRGTRLIRRLLRGAILRTRFTIARNAIWAWVIWLAQSPILNM